MKWGEPEVINFKVAYDGYAITNNEIDAKILANSLLGVSSAIEETNKILNPEGSTVFIKVKSIFKPGSFEVDLVQWLTSPGLQAVTNLITILGFSGLGGYGLLQVIKITNFNKIISKKTIDVDTQEVTFNNCKNPIVLQNSVVKCYENETVLNAIREVATPLGYDGYEEIGFSSDANQPELITKSDFPIFKIQEVSENEEILDSIESEGIFGIAQTNLEGYEKGWRLIKDDGGSFQVTILDKRFLNEVKTGKYSFSHGTAVRVRYRDITKKIVNIVHEYEIIEVISLYPPNSKIPKIVRKDHQLIKD